MLRCTCRSAGRSLLGPRARAAVITRFESTNPRSPDFTTPEPSLVSKDTTPTPPSRPPTFTTDAPVLVEESDPTKPTNLPIEDYASPLLHTYDVFAKLFRYAVFGSVAIVSLGVTGLVGVHFYVEKVELAKPKGEDEQHWEEDFEGWSGGHLGGGTDPRLGTTTRSAIRGAWIAQHWGTGAVGSPVSSSAFSVNAVNAGGAKIGAQNAKITDVGEIGDAGWQQAEGYLMFAIDSAQQKGISLCSPGAEAGTVVDRTALELEQRLASLRELIGGRYKLQEARDGWERIYYALSSSTNPTPSDVRERTKATKKLGDISARLAEMYDAGSEERRFEMNKAEGWLLGGLLTVLGAGAGMENIDIVAKSKSASPSSGFFGFWARSHPPGSTTTIRPEVRALVDALSLHATSPTPPFDPATSRTLLNSLTTLETFLARDRNLLAAQGVQSSSLSFTRSLSTPSPDIVRTEKILSKNEDKSAALYQLFLVVRESIFSTHLAEVSLALRQPAMEPTRLLEGSITDSQAVVTALEGSTLAAPLSFFASFSSSKDSVLQRRLGKSARDLLRDAALTGSMAASLSAIVCKDKEQALGYRATASGFLAALK